MLRSILSVVAGYAVWTLIYLGGNATLGVFMPDAFQSGTVSDPTVLILMLASSCLASLAAGYTTALVAGARPMLHAGWLVASLLATGIPVQISAWDDLPPWFHLTFLILLIPIPLAGAKLVKPRVQRTYAVDEGDF